MPFLRQKADLEHKTCLIADETSHCSGTRRESGEGECRISDNFVVKEPPPSFRNYFSQKKVCLYRSTRLVFLRLLTT